MNKLLELRVIKTHEILDKYIALENILFALPKGIWGFFKGLFKAVNYKLYTDKLALLNVELEGILADLNALGNSKLNKGESQLKDALSEFIEKLGCAIDALIKVNLNLAIKAEGKRYSVKEYQSDMAEYRSRVDDYYALGGRLNELYNKLI